MLTVILMILAGLICRRVLESTRPPAGWDQPPLDWDEEAARRAMRGDEAPEVVEQGRSQV